MEPSVSSTSPFPLEWLCCPLSRQPLAPADAETLARLEGARQSGTLRFVREPAAAQIDLRTPLEAALLREDGTIAYLISGGIPVLLPDHAITIPSATPMV